MKANFVLLFCTALTVLAYVLSRKFAKRYPSPLTTPVFFSTLVIIGVLSATGLDYQAYQPARDLMIFLLGPATIALAVPIYRNRETLRANAAPALLGIVAGTVASILTVLVLSSALGFSSEITRSMSVKSVTAPIAIELMSILKGNPVLAAVFVIVTGMIGTMLGPWLLTRTGIVHPLARGLALGTISHGQGTAQALTEGSLQGAIAGVAMGVSAIATSFALPFLLRAVT